MAAVDPDPAAARAAALGGWLPAAGTTVRVDRPGPAQVRVTVVHRLVTVVPLVGRLVPDLELRGDATFRAEWLPP